jgi:hypothetical protein
MITGIEIHHVSFETLNEFNMIFEPPGRRDRQEKPFFVFIIPGVPGVLAVDVVDIGIA